MTLARSDEMLGDAVARRRGVGAFNVIQLEHAEANRTATRAVVQTCHAAAVSVEAELGEIGGKDGVHARGVRTGDLVGAVHAGMTKVNIATHLNHAFTTALRGHLAADPGVVDPRRYLGAARDALKAEAARLLELLALR